MIVAGLLAFVIGCDGVSPTPEDAIAAAVAGELDPVNGLPTVVVNAFWCDVRVEACAPDSGGPSVSPLDATSIATPFAAALELPLVAPRDLVLPICPWVGEAAAEAGMYAQLVRPPAVDDDEGRVSVASGCSDGGAAFEQIHEFTLQRRGAEWVVVDRRLVSIT
jgi:hypothetical protein